jgi:hypothetical protein
MISTLTVPKSVMQPKASEGRTCLNQCAPPGERLANSGVRRVNHPDVVASPSPGPGSTYPRTDTLLAAPPMRLAPACATRHAQSRRGSRTARGAPTSAAQALTELIASISARHSRPSFCAYPRFGLRGRLPSVRAPGAARRGSGDRV